MIKVSSMCGKGVHLPPVYVRHERGKYFAVWVGGSYEHWRLNKKKRWHGPMFVFAGAWQGFCAYQRNTYVQSYKKIRSICGTTKNKTIPQKAGKFARQKICRNVAYSKNIEWFNLINYFLQIRTFKKKSNITDKIIIGLCLMLPFFHMSCQHFMHSTEKLVAYMCQGGFGLQEQSEDGILLEWLPLLNHHGPTWRLKRPWGRGYNAAKSWIN